MKLATYRRADQERLGAVLGDQLVDLTGVAATAIEFLRRGDDAVAAARASIERIERLGPDERAASGDLVALAEVELLPPVPRPPKVVCVARNYAEHAREAGRELPTLPILFTRFANTLVGDGAPVIRPTVSEELDWEGELAVIVGRPGGHLSKAEAMDHVGGYSIFNDVTVRDFQFRVSQYTAGKNFNASGPFGPFLVLRDEVSDPADLLIETKVNDELMQSESTSQMIFDIPTIIEHISEFIDLEVGDVIATGTPAGVGFKREPPRFLVPGDRVTVSIPGLGSLSNPVVEESR